MSHSRKFIRASFGVAIASACAGMFAACGGDTKSAPGNGAAGSSAVGSLQPGGAGTSSNRTTEGPPTVVGLDPNRDTTTPVNLGEAGAVACGGGGNFCVAPNPTCCAVGVAGNNNNNNNTFSCAASAADCPPNTISSTSCSSQLSCSSGQVCCRVDDGNGTAATCEANCAAGATQLCLDDAECTAGNVCNNNNVCAPPPCTADSCAAGELCCRGGAGGGGGAQPACVAPADDGLCPNGRRQVCTDATTCPAENTCSRLGGNGNGNNALVCTAPPCTPTSCAAGQVCCVGGGVNTPTCAAPSAMSACGNSRLVCITDAECAGVPGTVCRLGNNGQGSLSCRTPPPPPVTDAGVVADAG